MATISEPEIRTWLLDRRGRLERALETTPARDPLARLIKEVDDALERVDEGRWGLCEVCEGPIEPERLLADPLARFCVDDMTPVQKESLQRDLDLTQRLQTRLLPKPRVTTGAWEAASHYEPAGPVSGDCLDLVPDENGGLFFLLGDVAGKGLAASERSGSASGILNACLADLREFVGREARRDDQTLLVLRRSR